MIRTRYAPSPTGDPHIGNIRTALFEYLFAKANGGEFLLRIEDTDRERYVEGGVERIIESLKWLDIVPDNIENYPTQSERLEVYKKHAFDLVRAGKAYICTCSKEKLAEDHERQIGEGKPPRYEGHCRTADLKLEDMKEGCYVIRMKMPDGRKIIVDDLIRGKVEFDTSLLDDQIILKSDGYPTYHLAVVIDDAEMKITHVIRGEEWLSSTPKHLLLAEYLGFEPVRYAHLPVILGPDKKKLSKRHGATSLMGYKELGYLPEAIINFLALLGWNPKDDREEFTLAELEKEFKLENVNKAPAVFDEQKLKHLNNYWIVKKSFEIEDYLPEEVKILINKYDRDLPTGRTVKQDIISETNYRVSTLNEYADKIKFLGTIQLDNNKIMFGKSNIQNTLIGLKETLSELVKIDATEWYYKPILNCLTDVTNANNLSKGDVFWPVRYALTGEEKSPPPEMVATWLGKADTLHRIQDAINKLQ